MLNINNLDILNKFLKYPACIGPVQQSLMMNWFLFPMESVPHSLHRIKSSLWMKQGCSGQGHGIFPNIQWQEVEWKKIWNERKLLWQRRVICWFGHSNVPGQITSVTVLWNFLVIWASLEDFLPACSSRVHPFITLQNLEYFKNKYFADCVSSIRT